MRKNLLLSLLLIGIVVLGLITYGCGGTAATTATTAGTSMSLNGLAGGLSGRFEIPQVLAKGKAAGDWNDASFGHCNPWYSDRLHTPSSYVVGIAEMKMLTQNDYDDPNAFTVDMGATYSVTNPKIITLTSGPVSMAPTNTPPVGTYTHMGNTLVFVQQTISGCFSFTDPTSITNGIIRLYASTSGDIQAGDILFYKDNVWNWVKTDDTLVPVSQSRPGGTASGWDFPNAGGFNTGPPTRATSVVVLQDTFWSLRLTNNLTAQQQAMIADHAANNYVWKDTMAIPTAVTIAENHSYTGTMTFDVSVSTDTYFSGGAMPIPAANGTGCFFWDDVTADGVFKPFLSSANGGDQGNENGVASWCVLPPTATFTLTQTN